MAVGLLLMSYGSFSQTAEEMLPKAIQLEEVKGELEKAIEMYETIVKNFSENRAIAAKAQFHIGLCYEKLGRSEAMKAYRVVLGKFADQRKLAARAQEKLNALNSTRHNVKPLGIITREVWSEDEDVYAISSDGRYMSFIDWRSSLSIKIYDTKTGKIWPITKKGTWKGKYEFPDTSIFSPDGKQIAYFYFYKDNIELRIVNLDGSGMRVLCNNHNGAGVPWPVDWSQDGKYILAIIEVKDKTNRNKHKDQIVRVSVKDGSIETLKSLNNKHTRYLSFSPDGNSIVYDMSQADGIDQKDIYMRTIDGNKEVVISDNPANDWYPYWTNDGKQVIFLSDRSGSKGLWSQAMVNGLPLGDPILLKGNLENKFIPIGSTRSGSIYYSTGTSTRNIYSEGIDLRTGKRTSTSKKLSDRVEGGNTCPSWSPDGKYLAYLSQRGKTLMKNMTFVIHNIETGKEYDLTTQIKPGSGLGSFMPRWSPGSRYLIMTARKNIHDEDGIYQVDIKTGAHTQLVSFPGKEGILPQIAPDGSSLFYLRTIDGTLTKFDLKTAQKTVIFQSKKQLFYNNLSPDGKYLAFRYWFDNPNDLWIVSTTGGNPKKVGSLANDERIGWPVWTPDSRNVVVIAVNSRKVYQFPIDGSPAFMLEISMKNKRHLEIHPDGNRVVYDMEQAGRNQVWAIDNFLPKKE